VSRRVDGHHPPESPTRAGPDQGVAAVRTIKLCLAPTRRPTTLLGAIARSVAELEQTGRPVRTVRLPLKSSALA